MRGQISVELLIISAAAVSVLILLLSNYAELTDVVMGFLSKRRAEYVFDLMRDVADNCSSLEINVHFPFPVEYECGPSLTLRVGKYSETFPEISCIGRGRAKHLYINRCKVI